MSIDFLRIQQQKQSHSSLFILEKNGLLFDVGALADLENFVADADAVEDAADDEQKAKDLAKTGTAAAPAAFLFFKALLVAVIVPVLLSLLLLFGSEIVELWRLFRVSA